MVLNVIKPAQGSGGKGILVIIKHKDGVYTKPSGVEINKQDVERHITNTMAGLFSLGGKNDVAMVEDLIQFDDVFDGFSYEGVPDVRVIVFKGYPVMAMMRCSTAASDGKANLHQGAAFSSTRRQPVEYEVDSDRHQPLPTLLIQTMFRKYSWSPICRTMIRPSLVHSLKNRGMIIRTIDSLDSLQEPKARHSGR